LTLEQPVAIVATYVTLRIITKCDGIRIIMNMVQSLLLDSKGYFRSRISSFILVIFSSIFPNCGLIDSPSIMSTEHHKQIRIHGLIGIVLHEIRLCHKTNLRTSYLNPRANGK